MRFRPLTEAARRLALGTGSPVPPAAGFPVGKVLISAIGVLTPIGAFTADMSESHVYNPRWPPHAKFHNAQTMVTAVALPALSLWELWRRRPADHSGLRSGTLLAAMYYLTQAPAILFPGTAFFDPEFEEQQQPVVAGIKLNPLLGQVVIVYPVLAAGYALESRRLRRAGR